jgi:hypothetical protein
MERGKSFDFLKFGENKVRYLALLGFFIFLLSYFVIANAPWGNTNSFPLVSDSSQTWNDWIPREGLLSAGGGGISEIKTIQGPNDLPYVFALGSDNKAYVHYNNSWYKLSNSENPEGIFAREIHPVYDGFSDYAFIYVLNQDREIGLGFVNLSSFRGSQQQFISYFPGASGELSNKKFLSIQPLVAEGNFNIVFGIGLDNQVYYSYVEGDFEFGDWQPLPEKMVKEISVANYPNSNDFVVIAIDFNDVVWQSYNSEGTIGEWRGWRGLVTTSEGDLDCNELWWYNDTSIECEQKEFCGLYMYPELMTFETEEACRESFGDIHEQLGEEVIGSGEE